jgi:hypothetical protein
MAASYAHQEGWRGGGGRFTYCFFILRFAIVDLDATLLQGIH